MDKVSSTSDYAPAAVAFCAMAEALRVYLQSGKTRTLAWTSEELHAFLSCAIKNAICDVPNEVELLGKQVALGILAGMFNGKFDEPVIVTFKPPRSS